MKRSFGTFLAVGGAVGVATLLLREVLACLLPADVPLWYGVSVVVAYTVGIVASFFLQGRVTFARELQDLSWGQFQRFVVVAIAGALVALLTSLGVRYLLVLDLLLGELAATTAFAMGALAAAVFNFFFSAWLVFPDSPAGSERLMMLGWRARLGRKSQR
jgi:putative flippase GtrA